MKSCNQNSCKNCAHFTCYQIRFGAVYYCELAWDDDKREFKETFKCDFKENGDKENESDK